MLTGMVAGLAAGALRGLVFVAPRMLPMGAGAYSSIDLTAGRFAVYGAAELVVSETIFALLYSFLWDAHWPTFPPFIACLLFTLGIMASIRAHR